MPARCRRGPQRTATVMDDVFSDPNEEAEN
jgi:hypothetical protein